jgi:hypothetical protein
MHTIIILKLRAGFFNRHLSHVLYVQRWEEAKQRWEEAKSFYNKKEIP